MSHELPKSTRSQVKTHWAKMRRRHERKGEGSRQEETKTLPAADPKGEGAGTPREREPATITHGGRANGPLRAGSAALVLTGRDQRARRLVSPAPSRALR